MNNNNENDSNMNDNNLNNSLKNENEDESKYIYENKHRKFTQDDIDHISELCDFIAGIIIDEKNISVTNYFKNLDSSKQGFITMNQLKSHLEYGTWLKSDGSKEEILLGQ